MILANPVKGTIYLAASGSRFYRSQRFGCTGFGAERPLGDCAHFHRGVDIAPSDGRSGIPVYAAAAGTVLFEGRDTFGSIDVTLNHGDGQFTVYAHLAREIVADGQKVGRGAQIGVMGQSGNATGIHLHFAYKTGADPKGTILGDGNGTFRDPWPLIEQNVRVRPKNGDGIRIRSRLELADSAIYAEVEGGRLIRRSDHGDIGPVTTWRGWRGTVTGPTYSVADVSSNRWEQMVLDGGVRYVASLLAQRSAS